MLESSLDVLEREEALYAAAMSAIRKVAAPKPIGTGYKKADGLVDAPSSMGEYSQRRYHTHSIATNHQDVSHDNHNMEVVEDHSLLSGVVAASPPAIMGRSDTSSTPRRQRVHHGVQVMPAALVYLVVEQTVDNEVTLMTNL
jgi:hypothetical protein